MLNARWIDAAPTLAERTRRRVTLHLIPFLFILYILAYLDRTNVSVAELELTRPVAEGGMGFDKAVIGFGAGVFFWGYWILEIPSTVSVLKWGARWVFARILVLWGLCCVFVGCINMPFVHDVFTWLPRIPADAGPLLGGDQVADFLFGWTLRLSDSESSVFWFSGFAEFWNGLATSAEYQFYFFRFMLGFFEGGFFPSVIVYLSLWFRPEDRAKAIASFMSAIPLSSALGAPLSGTLLYIDWLGLPGWRWIFIIQGAVPVVAGFVTLFFLPDRPQKADWLPKEERDWLLGELQREHQLKAGQPHGHFAWVKHLWLVLLLTLVYFCLNMTSYGLNMFMPAILKAQIDPRVLPRFIVDRFDNPDNAVNFAATLLATPLYLMAFVAMLINGWHSDRRRERLLHVAVPFCGLSASVALAAALDGSPVWPVLVMIFLVGAFLYCHLPAYWPIPTMFLGSVAAASATGFINMMGNMGGFVGPYVVGHSAKEHTTFGPALWTLAPLPLVGAGIILLVGLLRRPQALAVNVAPPGPEAIRAGMPGTEVIQPEPPDEGAITDLKT